jgi:peptidoglycan/LPS O-acetylase OafA/YrhL
MASSTLIAEEKPVRSVASNSKPRIRTLDGWRGIAILLVLAEHSAFFSRFDKPMWAHLASFGVDIFFVISGYIITMRLIEERKKTGDVSLRRFYVRRAFRILPLIGAYLSILCIFAAFGRLIDFHWPEVLGSVLFFRNYQLNLDPRGTFTTHFWSLSIEEHFYLLWPALLVWLGSRRAMGFAMAGAVSCALWRAYVLVHPQYLFWHCAECGAVIWRTDTRCDGLLLGCMTAILLSLENVRAFVLRNFPKETPLFVAALLIVNLSRTGAMPTLTTYLLVCLMLVSTMVVEEGLTHKWLNNRLLVWIGTVSYSIYVWQQLFYCRPSEAFKPLGVLSTFPFNLSCVLALSALSYYFFEQPCIRLGKRLLHRRQREMDAELCVS